MCHQRVLLWTRKSYGLPINVVGLSVHDENGPRVYVTKWNPHGLFVYAIVILDFFWLSVMIGGLSGETCEPSMVISRWKKLATMVSSVHEWFDVRFICLRPRYGCENQSWWMTWLTLLLVSPSLLHHQCKGMSVGMVITHMMMDVLGVPLACSCCWSPSASYSSLISILSVLKWRTREIESEESGRGRVKSRLPGG
jgi:hypothetical protein